MRSARTCGPPSVEEHDFASLVYPRESRTGRVKACIMKQMTQQPEAFRRALELVRTYHTKKLTYVDICATKNASRIHPERVNAKLLDRLVALVIQKSDRRQKTARWGLIVYLLIAFCAFSSNSTVTLYGVKLEGLFELTPYLLFVSSVISWTVLVQDLEEKTLQRTALQICHIVDPEITKQHAKLTLFGEVETTPFLPDFPSMRTNLSKDSEIELGSRYVFFSLSSILTLLLFLSAILIFVVVVPFFAMVKFYSYRTEISNFDYFIIGFVSLTIFFELIYHITVDSIKFSMVDAHEIDRFARDVKESGLEAALDRFRARERISKRTM